MKQNHSSSHKRRSRSSKKRVISYAISLVCVVSAVVCLLVVGMQVIEDNKAVRNEAAARELYAGSSANLLNAVETPAPTVAPTEEATQSIFTPLTVVSASTETQAAVAAVMETPAPRDHVDAVKVVDGVPQMQESFTHLYNTNPDAIGWLIAGDAIDQAIVRRDNEFYLDHDLYGNYNKAGIAFVDARCNVWPRNQHVIIHGHNMKNDTVFGTLDRFRTLDYLKQYPIVTFNTIYADAQYVPIAIFDASMTSTAKGYFKIINWDFETEEAFNTFIQELRNVSLFDIPVEVAADDALLTLMTCSYSHEDGRFLVVCRRVREDESIETLTEQVQAATAK